MAVTIVRTNEGQEFMLTQDRLRSRVHIGSYLFLKRVTLRKVLKQINSLFDLKKSKVIIENLGLDTRVVVRKVRGFEKYGRVAYPRPWNVRLHANGTLQIGCKVFAGHHATAIKAWAN